MAAPAKKTVRVSDDSSSSDDEELKRCQEAVWEIKTNKTKDGDSNAKESKRVLVADHEHDGNELQVTKEFRAHVAKKLGHQLDSCISVMQPDTSSCLKSTNCDDDEGFRLFSTSVPEQKADEPQAPVRRRPVPSSSDSDSEMEARLKEAAVSIRDLLPSSSFSSTLSQASAQPPSLEGTKKNKKASQEEESLSVKKKKKRKQNQEESEQVDSAGFAPSPSNGENGDSEQKHIQVKRKKKKRRDGNAKEGALN
ncbi:protein CUSTOS [Odontesthes bonariensis]|uniref:protein CUSTOS n=1 Tax=Odontesthes bonariensis TaxID=219752 RepID=UPI003F58BAD5